MRKMAMESGERAERGDWDHDGHLVVVMSGAIMGIPAWNALAIKPKSIYRPCILLEKTNQLSRLSREIEQKFVI